MKHQQGNVTLTSHLSTDRQQRDRLPGERTSWRDAAISSDGRSHSFGRTVGLFIWISVYFLLLGHCSSTSPSAHSSLTIIIPHNN